MGHDSNAPAEFILPYPRTAMDLLNIRNPPAFGGMDMGFFTYCYSCFWTLHAYRNTFHASHLCYPRGSKMVVLIPNFLAKMASAYLMDKCIWYPLTLAIGSLALAFAALNWKMPFEAPRQHNNGHFVVRTLRTRFSTLRVLFTSPKVFFLILTFSFTNVFGQLMSGSTLLQVLTRKFGMSLKDASKIQSLSNLVNLPPLALIYLFPTGWDNLNVCCFCASCSMVGLLLMGIAQSWEVVMVGFVFCAAGQGFRMAARSELSLTKNIQREDISSLYILIFYIDMIGGGFFNAWALARAFNESLDDGGFFLGLPLFVAVAEWYIVLLIVTTIKIVPHQRLNGTGFGARESFAHLNDPYLNSM
ncbi:hypothetical protein ONS96_000037 [Cadophora gregata f. sp. sojae]|nr:hypothetical protein ONS96_000037 [Cadophora gregata f. sp. sojae]